MNTKYLGIFALVGAPCLAIGLQLEPLFGIAKTSWWMPIWGILYITGWMASIEALRRLGACGSDRFGIIIVRVVLGTLLLANVSNVWEAVAPLYKPALYYVFDIGWPGSNLLMLAVGAAAIRAKQLPGWQRWVPLAVGCWFPVTMTIWKIPGFTYAPLIYSAVAWTLLAVVVLLESARQKRAQLISETRLGKVEGIYIGIA